THVIFLVPEANASGTGTTAGDLVDKKRSSFELGVEALAAAALTPTPAGNGRTNGGGAAAGSTGPAIPAGSESEPDPLGLKASLGPRPVLPGLEPESDPFGSARVASDPFQVAADPFSVPRVRPLGETAEDEEASRGRASGDLADFDIDE